MIFARILLLFTAVLCAINAAGQTTAPPNIRSGDNLPANCTPATGSSRTLLFYKTGASPGLQQCLTQDTWTPVGSGNGSAAAAGSGTEVQINSGGALAALSGSSSSGANLNLGGQLAVTGGNVIAGRDPVSVTETSEADFDAGTKSNTDGNADGTLSLLNAANGTTKAVRFQGSRSNQVQIPHNAAYNLTGDLTIEGWAYLENATAFSPIITKGASGGTFDLVIQSGGGYAPGNYGYVRFGQGGTYASTQVVGALRLNQWHHVAVTKSGTTLKFYINGVLVSTQTFSPTVPTNTDAVYIGHAPDAFLTAGYLFRGSLFDVRVWGVARSAAEVAANMDTLTPAGSGLVGQWKMQEGSGTAIADSSATANNGTLSGLDYAWQTVTQNYATSGTRTSPVYDISAAKTISTSAISWTATTPDGHTVTVETRYSTNGGSSYTSYAAATNGSTIPGLSSSTDLSNGRLQIRETLTSPTSKASPIFAEITATLTTPAYQYNLGVRTTAPAVPLDAGTNQVQGKMLDTGGLVINVTAPRYGAIANDGLADDVAFALALADLGPANTFAASTGKIAIPRGTFDLASDLELNHVIILEGAGGDNNGPGTTLSFADGKGVKIPACEVFGGYGTDFGCGKGSVIRDLRVVSKAKANAPTSTVNVSGLSVTRTAGTLFNYEKWGGSQVVKIGSTYARVADWLTDTTCTLYPLYYRGTVSGSTVALQFGNNFPAGLSAVTVKIDGASYTVNSSTTTVLTLASSPAETGSRTIEIQSLGTLSSQAMAIYVNHGIEVLGTAHLYNVAVSGFAGNGIDLNTANFNYENARNSNTFQFYNAISIDNEGDGFLIKGSNANASVCSGCNGFNNKGSGIWEYSQFGNTYIGPHVDSNRMEAFAALSSSSIVGLYSEGNQPSSRFKRPSGVGTVGPVVIAGFHGAGITYDSDAMILSDSGAITGVNTLTTENSITNKGPMTFSGSIDSTRRINFGYGVSGATESSNIQQNNNTLNLLTNTYSAGGGFVAPTDTSKASWWNLISSGGDYVRWYRAPATAGTPSFSQVAEISATGFSTNNITAGGKLYITNPETPASASSACTVGQQAWDTNFHYVCVATNTWKRAALSTW